MSWDESLFGAAWSWAGRVKAQRQAAAVEERGVPTAPELERLKVLARLLTGAPLAVEVTAGAGGLCGDTLLLPPAMALASTRELNREALVVRVAWGAVAHQLGVAPRPGEDGVLAMARHAAAVRACFLDAYPARGTALGRLERAALAARPPVEGLDLRAQGLEAAVRLALGALDRGALAARAWGWAEAVLAGDRPPPLPVPRLRWRSPPPLPAVPVWGALVAAPPRERVAAAERLEDGGVEAGATERKKPAAAPATRVEEPEQGQGENPLVHSFEKVHTLEAYQGGSKRVDGDDELAAHQKALDELDLKQVVRSRQRARSLYRADLLLEGGPDELEGGPVAGEVLRYDEWDQAKVAWRREWCALSTHLAPALPDAAGALADIRARQARVTARLRAVFEQVEAGRAWKLRQRHGVDVDVDAVVARYGALRAGSTGEDRLYAARRRHTRDTAVLVLLDTSLSTDAWVANRRVLDVEKESVIALGDALEGLFDEVGVAAFCSQSRLDCRFLVAKGFSEPWELGARRVLGLVPAGFTRIGPAVRHATAELGRCGARRKLLVLLTDGKPSDVDRYEGRYGVADVHRAVLDAHAEGVTVHALALDPAARSWLPSMFGPGRATVVGHPDDLVTAMAAVTTGALRA